jgi:hypothetical protein
MNLDFSALKEHIISIEEFSLKYRFTKDEYTKLPFGHLHQLKPLDKIGYASYVKVFRIRSFI